MIVSDLDRMLSPKSGMAFFVTHDHDKRGKGKSYIRVTKYELEEFLGVENATKHQSMTTTLGFSTIDLEI